MIRLVPLTAFYAAVHAVLILVLAVRVVLLRRATKTGLGDGSHDPLAKAIRAHGNAVEYIPLILVLMLLLELNGTGGPVLHALGGSLLVARLLHAWGLSQTRGMSFGRFYGTALTWLVLLAAAGINVATALY